MQKPKILMVEDEDESRSLMVRFLLRNLDCEIAETGEGSQALEMLKKDKFDVLLLDLKIKGISGLDVLSAAKKASPETEVIVLSGYDSPQMVNEAFQKGAYDYILKSTVSRDFILEKIIEVLKKKNIYLPPKDA